MTSTLGPGGHLESEQNISHNCQFLSRFSYITIHFNTNEALSIRMRGVDSIKTGIIIITHCSVIRLLKHESGKQQIIESMFMVHSLFPHDEVLSATSGRASCWS